MKYIKEDFIQIFHTERGVLLLMVLNLLASIALIIFSLVSLNPAAPVAKVGYSDLSGYRDGTWIDFLAFPLLGLVFGIMHNFLTLRVFYKRGSGMAKFFSCLTFFLILGTFLVLVRIHGEG